MFYVNPRWKDIIPKLGLRYGFILFIVSEVMFFFAFFWAFFHSSLAPTVEIGGIWPPLGIWVLDPWEIPFLNSPFIRSCRNLGSSCYTRGEGKTSCLRFSSYRFTGSSIHWSVTLHYLWFYLFLSNWLSWFSCDYRYSFLDHMWYSPISWSSDLGASRWL